MKGEKTTKTKWFLVYFNTKTEQMLCNLEIFDIKYIFSPH